MLIRPNLPWPPKPMRPADGDLLETNDVAKSRRNQSKWTVRVQISSAISDSSSWSQITRCFHYFRPGKSGLLPARAPQFRLNIGLGACIHGEYGHTRRCGRAWNGRCLFVLRFSLGPFQRQVAGHRCAGQGAHLRRRARISVREALDDRILELTELRARAEEIPRLRAQLEQLTSERARGFAGGRAILTPGE